MAKQIIGDYSLPWKTSEDLLGFSVGTKDQNPYQLETIEENSEVLQIQTKLKFIYIFENTPFKFSYQGKPLRI